MKNTHANFEYERFYHVFNRTNNKEILFRNDENKNYFLSLINNRLHGYAKLYAYALLGNHFHFVISICSEEDIVKHIKKIPSKKLKKTELEFLESKSDDKDIHKLIATQWSRVFNSYTQAINKRYKRTGHLFHAPFKRSAINAESKFSFLIYYIHHNSRKHGLVQDFLSDQWHSYHEILQVGESFIEREYIIDSFGSREKFIQFHKGKYLENDFNEFGIE